MCRKSLCKNLVAGICMSLACLGIAVSGSCQISPEGITVLSADYALPTYQSCRLSDASTLLVEFNAPVTLSDVHISPVDDSDDSFAEAVPFVQVDSDDENVSCIQVHRSLTRGREYVLYANAADSRGNSVYFSTVLQGFNQTPARALLSEVRTTYSNPKCEFVELLILNDGNLAGMVLESFYNGKSNRFVLPDVDVHAGEYVVLHLRKVNDSCIDEMDDDLTACTMKDASPGRDLWRNETNKIIGTTGVLLLWDRAYGNVIDCLLFAESAKESWPSSIMSDAAQTVTAMGLWTGSHGIDGAASSDAMTVTRTLCRWGLDELYQKFQSDPEALYPVPVNGDDWYVVATSCASPGKLNSTIAYE